jgi:hypothetical protein
MASDTKARDLSPDIRPAGSYKSRLRLWAEYYHWLILAGLAVAAVGLASWGFHLQAVAMGQSRSLLDVVYASLQLFVLESTGTAGPMTWHLQVARFLAPGLAGYAAVRALAEILREQHQMLRLCFLKDHVIVCGLGRRGFYLARAFKEADHKVIVIERDAENDNLSYCRSHGIITLLGDCTASWLLKKARVQSARYLFAVCGSDGANAEAAVVARQVAAGPSGRKFTCYAHVINLELCRLLRERQLKAPDQGEVRIEFFNIFETGAVALLKRFPLKSRFDPDRGDRTHLLVVGLGKLGESLVVHALRQWHGLHLRDSRQFSLTVIDKRAGRLTEVLRLRYPRITDFCKLTSLEMDVKDPEFAAGAFLADAQGGPVTSAYVCLDDDSLSLSAGLTLHRRAEEIGQPTQIVSRMAEGVGLAKLLKEQGRAGGEYEGLRAFCLLDNTCSPEILVGGPREIIARAIHEDYVRNEEAKGITREVNPSMVPWEILPEDLKESNRQQADHMSVRLGAFGYTIASLTDWEMDAFEFTPQEVEGMARMEHDRWCEGKRKAGYTHAPGPKTATTHPDLVPYDELSEEAKDKDRNTVRALPRFLAAAGFQIKRLKRSGERKGA